MPALACRRRIVLLCPLLLTLAAAGCGQKGPLFFPPEVSGKPVAGEPGVDGEGEDEQISASTGG